MKKLKIIEKSGNKSYGKYDYWPNPSSAKSFKQIVQAVQIDITLLMNSGHMNGHNFQILTGMIASLDTMVVQVFDHLKKTCSADEMDVDDFEDVKHIQKAFKEIMEGGGYKTWKEFRDERRLEREADAKAKEKETKE